jgi:hypothetical protein
LPITNRRPLGPRGRTSCGWTTRGVSTASELFSLDRFEDSAYLRDRRQRR